MSACKSASKRPLSPFMLGKHYRFQLTSCLSITHRITGIALTGGAAALTGWVLCAAWGPKAYASYLDCAHTIVGQLLLLAWSWALFYHLSNGIRHLVWDAGYCLELDQVYFGGWVALAASVALTAALWLLVCLY